MSLSIINNSTILEEENEAVEPQPGEELFPNFGFTQFRDHIQRLLYIPFDKIQKLGQVFENYPHIKSFILDSEDAIPDPLKDQAREKYLFSAESVNNLRDRTPFLWGCRINKPIFKGVINPLDHGRKDLSAIMPFKPDFLVVPKINNPKELDLMSDLCSQYESEDETVKFILIIESLEGAKNIKLLIEHPRTAGAIPGAQDYALDVLENFYGMAISNSSAIADPQLIRSAFLSGFNSLRDNIVRICHKFDKTPIAPSSFSSNYETSRSDYIFEILEYGFSGRTAIHPDQFPDTEEFNTYKQFGLESDKNNYHKRKELYFPQLKLSRLKKYLRLAMNQAVPGYFTCDKENKSTTIPNQFGQPVIRMIFLLLVFYLADLIKKKDYSSAFDLRKLLAKAKETFDYPHVIDLHPGLQ